MKHQLEKTIMVSILIFSTTILHTFATDSFQGTRKLAVIESDLAEVDISIFEQKMIDGKLIRKVDFDLQIEFGSRLGVLRFMTKIGEQEIGSTTVGFDGRQQLGAIAGSDTGDTETTRSCVIQ